MGFNLVLGRWWIRFFFAWYDLWIGAYWDRERKIIYLLPVPCFGVALKRFPVFDLRSENAGSDSK